MTEYTWSQLLTDEKQKEYFQALKAFITQERLVKTVYPSDDDIFRAFHLTPYNEVRVVILGQDPYHNGASHGLAFSTKNRVTPESLKNIFQEVEEDYFNGQGMFLTNDLSQWARQGVLLLNAVLTVEKGKPGSHADKGWERFTVEVITRLNEINKDLVYMLWGSYARRYAKYISNPKHLILTAPHPSPLSADKGFFGCKHFSRCNEHLIQNQNGSKIGINWGIF